LIFLVMSFLGFSAETGTNLNNLAPEFFSLSITILILDALYRYRADQQDKKRIMKQLASYINDSALDAWRIAGDLGWTSSGVLNNIDLSGANLSGIVLVNALLNGVNLTGANLSKSNLGAAFYAKGASETSVAWSESDTKAASLIKAEMKAVNLEGSSLFRTNLEGADLWGANLRNADMYETNLKETNLMYADFTGSMLTNVNFDGAKYNSGTVWPKDFHIPEKAVDIDKIVCLIACPDNIQALEGVKLARQHGLFDDRIYFQNSSFIGANLEKANLSHTLLFSIDFSKANLTFANFEESDLRACNLQGANLLGACLRGAKFKLTEYDSETIWPEGFDPRKTDAVYVELKLT
jgi:uncharacterized protein YjbI with pentapeptide repeats